MRTIYKYKLEITDQQLLTIPEQPHFLHVGEQDGELMLWAEVDSEKEKTNFEVYVCGTGNPIPEKAKHYLGTVQIEIFVWHVFLNLNDS